PWRAATLHQKIHLLLHKKFLHLTGHLLHIAIAGEKNEGGTVGLFDEMRDPAFQFFLISRIARIGHFSNHEQFHLLLKIERTAKLQRFGFSCTDPVAEISEIGAPDGKGGTGHDAATIVPEDHPPQNRREIDRRGVKRKELRRLSGPLDPVNVLRRALFEEYRDPFARVVNSAAKFLQLGFQNFVICAFHYFGNARLERDQSTGNRILDKIDIAHAELATFSKIRFRFYRVEEFLQVVDQLGRKAHPGGIAHDGEESFSRSWVVEPLDGRSQSILR